MTIPTLEHLLEQMQHVNATVQSLQADKQQQVLQAMQRKQLMAALDHPQVRGALRAQVQAAAQQVDALASQLDEQRKAVAAAQSRIKAVLDKLDGDTDLSKLLAARLDGALGTATSALKQAGVATSAPKATKAATERTPTARKARRKTR